MSKYLFLRTVHKFTDSWRPWWGYC